ncbi:hypothetical protein [Pseudanabaena sp. 'Roaring Creek']|uniref:hypothetical protein n=1 Tax=Pseudanabaena sp. 'Roaring Creek' TaxID=1681830 RepID=UPI0006D80B17|nr:hypothetical protein [Pseudanabaena sp. 'Roaring Creek']
MIDANEGIYRGLDLQRMKRFKLIFFVSHSIGSWLKYPLIPTPEMALLFWESQNFTGLVF